MNHQPANSAERIIVIDDDKSVHEAYRKVLHREGEKRPGRSVAEKLGLGRGRAPETPVSVGREFEVDFAKSGEEGLKRVQQARSEGRPYALAFVDMRMPPGWDGLQTARELWKDSPDLQICICSAYSDHSWESVVGQLGDSDRLLILRKPFEREEVLQLAHMLTRKWRREQLDRHAPLAPTPEPPFHLLLLEDEPLTSSFLQKKLRETFPQIIVLPATTVAEAQVILATQAIDFFLLDILVPDGSGIDFLFQVMASQPGARAVMMTGQALGEYRAVAEQLGVLDFVEKPVSMPELAVRIQHQIDAKNAEAHGTSCFAATLTQLTTIDIIQLKCLAKATVTLDFARRDGVCGRIWFERGEIIHAQVLDKIGEAAFAEIVGWRNGRVQEVAGGLRPDQTISTQWQNLLLNTAQMLDERQAA